MIPFTAGDKIICYARYSGGEGQKNLDVSVDQQVHEVREFCRKYSLEYFKEYSDAGISGTSTDHRDGFRQMMTDLSRKDYQKSVRGVVVWSYSRFARNLDDASYFKSTIRRLGYQIYSLQEPVEDSNMGRVIEFLNDWQNAEYSKKVSADVKRALKADWEVYGVIGGIPPIGFIRVPVELPPHKDGSPRIRHRWEPDPAMIPAVREAFELKANGKLSKDIMAVLPYKTPQSLREMFDRTIYYGSMTFAGITKDDYCEPIVSREVWEKAHEMQAARTCGKCCRNDAIGLGIVHCGLCGAEMQIMRRTVKGRYRYEHYVCYECRKMRQIQRDVIESAIMDFIENEILKSEHVSAMLQDALKQAENALNQREQRITALKAQNAAIERKIANLVDAVANYGMNMEFMCRLDSLKLEKEQVADEIARIPDAYSVSEDVDRWLEVTDKIKVRLFSSDVPMDEKRRIIRTIIDRVNVLNGDEMEIFYHLPIFNPSRKGRVEDLCVRPQGNAGFLINSKRVRFKKM